uniref:Uncharacterized protein n=1 Tax=Leviviridae sp. TaxID=2027243 RepID=A0A514D2R5_9VIRU|nr:MAG: hypothetical protein H2RhizoLitter493616_000001 [Leviviridae sp.]
MRWPRKLIVRCQCRLNLVYLGKSDRFCWSFVSANFEGYRNVIRVRLDSDLIRMSRERYSKHLVANWALLPVTFH